MKVSRQLLVAALALASLGAGSPAERYCASLGQGSDVARAESALEFYRQITTDLQFPTSSACLATHIEGIHAKASVYCAARRARGHDAVANPLHDFEFEMMLKTSNCMIDISDDMKALLEPPITCESLSEALDLLFAFLDPAVELGGSVEDDAISRLLRCTHGATEKMRSELDATCKNEAEISEAYAAGLVERAYAECAAEYEEISRQYSYPEPE